MSAGLSSARTFVRAGHSPALLGLLALASLTAGCFTESSETRGWGAPAGYPAEAPRTGHVEYIRETVQRQHGDPVGGAIAGGVIGAIVGDAIVGHGAGALVGAAGGAAIGAQSSQGGGEHRFYEIFVRFDDGSLSRYVYDGYPPFQIGEPVMMTPQGLSRRY